MGDLRWLGKKLPLGGYIGDNTIQPTSTKVPIKMDWTQEKIAPTQDNSYITTLQNNIRRLYPSGDPNVRPKTNYSMLDMLGDSNEKPSMLDILQKFNKYSTKLNNFQVGNHKYNLADNMPNVYGEPLTKTISHMYRLEDNIKKYLEKSYLSGTNKKIIDDKLEFFRDKSNRLQNSINELKLKSQQAMNKNRMLELVNHPQFMNYLSDVAIAGVGNSLPNENIFKNVNPEWDDIGYEKTDKLPDIIKQALIDNANTDLNRLKLSRIFKRSDNVEQSVKDYLERFNKIVGGTRYVGDVENRSSLGSYNPYSNVYRIDNESSFDPHVWFHEAGHATNLGQTNEENDIYKNIRNDEELRNKVGSAFLSPNKNPKEIADYMLSPDELIGEKRALELLWKLKYGVEPNGKFTHQMYEQLPQEYSTRFKEFPYERVKQIWEETK